MRLQKVHLVTDAFTHHAEHVIWYQQGYNQSHLV